MKDARKTKDQLVRELSDARERVAWLEKMEEERVRALSTPFAKPHCQGDQELRMIDLLVWTASDFAERRRAEEVVKAQAAELAAANEELKRTTRKFELLAGIAARLLHTTNPRSDVEPLCLEVMEFLDCHVFFNYLINKECGRLSLNASSGIPLEEVGKIEWLDFGDAVCGCVARDGHPIVVDHILSIHDERTEFIKLYGIRAYACHPLLSAGGDTIGTLAFGTSSHDFFSQDDLSVMKAVTDQVATAMNRLEAEREIRRHRDNLEELVLKRTMELEERNAQLKEEMKEREKAVAAKRAAEEQLAQAQRIEALDRFAGGIAHDLNNILSPIIINLEELHEDEEPGSERHGILEETLRAAYRQRDLVRKILSFGRRSDQALKPMHMGPLLEETLALLRSVLPSTIELLVRIDAHTDVIRGDPVQIQQVIMNLCRNAADAAEDQKGVIEVRLETDRLSSEHRPSGIPGGEYLRLTVRDSGLGMEPHVMERIFEPFYTTKGIGKGSGMGLSIVHGIVKSHGGAITVESRPGKGAVFKAYFPLACAEHPAPSPEMDRTSLERGRERILLVDDEEIILTSFSRTLKKAGYEVFSARRGEDAFSLFTRMPGGFDLVVTDMTMPEMTGLELARKLLGIRPGLPVILCTGFNDSISPQEAKLHGIRQLLLKPVGAGELKKVILHTLES